VTSITFISISPKIDHLFLGTNPNPSETILFGASHTTTSSQENNVKMNAEFFEDIRSRNLVQSKNWFGPVNTFFLDCPSSIDAVDFRSSVKCIPKKYFNGFVTFGEGCYKTSQEIFAALDKVGYNKHRSKKGIAAMVCPEIIRNEWNSNDDIIRRQYPDKEKACEVYHTLPDGVVTVATLLRSCEESIPPAVFYALNSNSFLNFHVLHGDKPDNMPTIQDVIDDNPAFGYLLGYDSDEDYDDDAVLSDGDEMLLGEEEDGNMDGQERTAVVIQPDFIATLRNTTNEMNGKLDDILNLLKAKK
jgi:hypothetical protein